MKQDQKQPLTTVKRRMLPVVGTILTLLTGVLAVPASAATDTAVAADFCSVGAITDVVDRTADVYGGGWMNCQGRTEHIRLWVTLYRDGSAISTGVCEERPSLDGSCDAATTVTDRWAGNQSWQTQVRGQWLTRGEIGNTTAWSNTLYH